MSFLAPLSRGLRRLLAEPSKAALPPRNPTCPVCGASTSLLDAVDFNKNCEEARGLHLPKSGVPVAYVICDACRFCFAPELHRWPVAEFEKRIYNADYAQVDPDYISARPESNAAMLHSLFTAGGISHLDYGGGSGVLSRALVDRGWNSQTYDPFVDPDVQVERLGRFDLVTAFEVFEHVPDIDKLFADLQAVLKPDGLLLFSTLLSDGQIEPGKPLHWWYAAPRNGHISLFSAESMRICMQQHDLNFASASAGLHVAYRQVPTWARHVLGPGPA